MKQTDKREIAGFDAAVAAAVAALPKLVPLTTTVAGEPMLVFGNNDTLVMVEVPA